MANPMIRWAAKALVTQGQLAWRAVAARVAARTRWVVVVVEVFSAAVSSARAWFTFLASRMVARVGMWSRVARRQVWRSSSVVSGRRGRRQPWNSVTRYSLSFHRALVSTADGVCAPLPLVET